MSEPLPTRKPPRPSAPTISDPWDPGDEQTARPARYLLERGWQATGHPNDPRTRWLDPQSPTSDTETKVHVGTITHENGEVEQIEQTVVSCRAWPLSLEEAIMIQQMREKTPAGR